MNEKVARASLRLALTRARVKGAIALFRKRIRYPKISMLKELLASEGLISISKEILQQYLQRRLERRG